MGRTTIYRFEGAARLALVAGLLWGLVPALRAQDTTRARPDTTKPVAQDTGQGTPAPTAAPTLAAQGQVPETHTVTRGETLWSISQLYYSDPLLWPDIYRLNTDQVDDPHWVYPGEILRLAPGAVAQAPETTAVASVPPAAPADTVQAQAAPTAPSDTVAAVKPPPTDTARIDTTQAVVEAPPPPPPPPEPTEVYQTVFERRPSATQQVRSVLRGYENLPYRPLRRGEFYSAGFLTEGQSLPYGHVLGNTSVSAIPRLTDQSDATTFEQIAIEGPGNASYHVGDSLLILRVDRDIGGWGGVVVPAGAARVTEVQRRQVLANVIMQFSRIRNGYLSLPLEPFKDPGLVRPAKVAHGLEGIVIAQRDVNVLTGMQQIIFINRGWAEGVALGDMFEVFVPAAYEPGTASEQVEVVLEIVHTREHSSSGLVLNIEHPRIAPGMPARLVRKMPS
jgi:LysM repeat protein